MSLRSPDQSTSNEVPLTASVDKPSDHSIDPRHGHTYQFSSASEPPTHTNPKAKQARRPHTSAGPRDKPNRFGISRSYEPLPSSSQLFPDSARPETADPSPLTTPSEVSRTWRHIWPEVSRFGLKSSSNSESHNRPGTRSRRVQGNNAPDHIRQDDEALHAWEEELARIESTSRKSSAGMFGFITQRKRSTGILPTLRTFLPAPG